MIPGSAGPHPLTLPHQSHHEMGIMGKPYNYYGGDSMVTGGLEVLRGTSCRHNIVFYVIERRNHLKSTVKMREVLQNLIMTFKPYRHCRKLPASIYAFPSVILRPSCGTRGASLPSRLLCRHRLANLPQPLQSV